MAGPRRFAEGWDTHKPYLTNWIKHVLGERNGLDMSQELPAQSYGPRGFAKDEPISAGMLPRVASFPYIETQTHGGLPWSDVRAMVAKGFAPDVDMAAAQAQRMADKAGLPSFAGWRNDTIGGTAPEWMLAHPGDSVNNVLSVPADSLKRFGYAQGGQIPGYAEGGYDDDPSQRYSIPPGSFGLPTPPTPTFQVPIGKGQATVGSNYDMINKIIEAQLGYEHPVGSHGARLGVSGNFNKYIGEGGDQVKPNWGVGLRLNLPFAEGGQYDPYDDIAEAQRLMGAYK
jgi:hypothetical protein